MSMKKNVSGSKGSAKPSAEVGVKTCSYGKSGQKQKTTKRVGPERG